MRNRLLVAAIVVITLFLAACEAENVVQDTQTAYWDLTYRIPIDEAEQIVVDINQPFNEVMDLIVSGLIYGDEMVEFGGGHYYRATPADHPIQSTQDIYNVFLAVFTQNFVDTVIEPMLFNDEMPFYVEIDGVLHRLAADFVTLWALATDNIRVGMFTSNSFSAIVPDARHWHAWGETGMYLIDFMWTQDGWRIDAIETFHGGLN
ncbi:MAG: hypothetical protein FWE33_05200 [Defluviitaleaceae bacterium]|nr:hypothetical protein [Defluviitaleaceae bacterium]